VIVHSLAVEIHSCLFFSVVHIECDKNCAYNWEFISYCFYRRESIVRLYD